MSHEENYKSEGMSWRDCQTCGNKKCVANEKCRSDRECADVFERVFFEFEENCEEMNLQELVGLKLSRFNIVQSFESSILVILMLRNC